ncbi:oxygenase MpaB family protein [Nocardia tengchongensis]
MVSHSAVSDQGCEPHFQPRPLGPDSLTWKTFGSLYFLPSALFVGMVQNMHPRLGAGVEFHSEIHDEFYRRILRSLYPIYGVVFDGDRAPRTAREILVRQLPKPLWEYLIRPAGGYFYQFVTIGLCDPEIRATMGFPWTARDQRRFDRLCRTLSAMNRVTPDGIKYFFPRIHAARRRVAGKRPAWLSPPEAPEMLWPGVEHRGEGKHYCPVHADRGSGSVTRFRQLTGF